jgi:hypothetical protein
MANLYTWQIMQLDCYPEKDGRKDVVFTIHWRRAATNGVKSADIYGSKSVILDPNEPFIPYNELTESQVVSWLENSISQEILAQQIASLDKQIEDQINPPIIYPALPW